MNDIDSLITIVRVRYTYGQTVEEIQEALSPTWSNELIFLAYKAVQMLEEEAKKEEELC